MGVKRRLLIRYAEGAPPHRPGRKNWEILLSKQKYDSLVFGVCTLTKNVGHRNEELPTSCGPHCKITPVLGKPPTWAFKQGQRIFRLHRDKQENRL